MDIVVTCDTGGMCGTRIMLMSAVSGLTGRRLACVVSRIATAMAGYVVWVTSLFLVAYGISVLAISITACVSTYGVWRKPFCILRFMIVA